MNSGIQNHGTLERLVKTEAEYWGWKARLSDIDVDPHDTDILGNPRRDPGRGDVIVSHEASGAHVVFEYHLPESVDDIREQIRSVIKADAIEQYRHKHPDRAMSPYEVR